MNSQPVILEGLNNDRRNDLYLSAATVQTGRGSVRPEKRQRFAGLAAAISSALVWLRVTNRQVSVNAHPVSGR